MLSERDRETLRALELRLEHEDPAFVRSFGAIGATGATGARDAARPAAGWERRLYTLTIVVAVLLGVWAILMGAWAFLPAVVVAVTLLAVGRKRCRRPGRGE